jgi:hypothetical protein
MASVLHLVKADSAPVAPAVIAEEAGGPDTSVTVVLLDDTPAPALPATTRVRRLGHDLDHDGLLELIFSHDRVVSW